MCMLVCIFVCVYQYYLHTFYAKLSVPMLITLYTILYYTLHTHTQVGDQIEAYSLLSGESFTGHVTVIDSEEVSVWVNGV